MYSVDFMVLHAEIGPQAVWCLRFRCFVRGNFAVLATVKMRGDSGDRLYKIYSVLSPPVPGVSPLKNG
ncbi:hypothetical protein D4410_14335 [Salmonella enterica subsp. enterica serovar Kottbus]|nr:hypothetical protein [Salmonella enterica subsp. enterica serovar Kottbus]